MTKLQYVVRPESRPTLSQFRERVLEQLVPDLLEREPIGLKVTVTVDDPPRLSVIPFRRAPLALISIEHEADGGHDWFLPLSRFGRISGYRVVESVPLDYQRDWPDGEPTPGVGLLTLFARRRGLDLQAFIKAWHGGHTPLSLEIHPIWRYERNVVQAVLLDGSPPFDAIVEEHFRSREDLLNPLRFFGGAARMVPNMVRVAADIRRFIHLRSMESYLVSEHHIRS